MNNHSDKNLRYNERGSAGIKVLLALMVLALIGNAGYSYIPTVYQGEDFKQDMKTAVMQGAIMPSTYGKPKNNVTRRLMKEVTKHNLPEDTFVEVKVDNKVVVARVYYTKKVSILPFGIYEFDYEFDETATPKGFTTE